MKDGKKAALALLTVTAVVTGAILLTRRKPPPPEGGLVAAFDSSESDKEQAAYICDGRYDQLTINTAFEDAQLNGRRIQLADGAYWVDNSIRVPSGFEFMARGEEAVINLMSGVSRDINVITNSDIINGNDHITIRGLKVNGNKENQIAGYQCGIHLESVTNCKVLYCVTENFRNHGIRLRKSGSDLAHGDNIIAHNVSLYNGDIGIYLTTSHYNTASNNICQWNGRGIYTFLSSYNTISYNVCNENGGGVSIGCGIWIDQHSANNTVHKNECRRNQAIGISLDNAVWENIVSENICQGNGAHGILVSEPRTDHNTISNNTCAENSQQGDMLYDNIHIYRCSYNLIMGNLCGVGWAANRPRYGINIVDPECVQNIVQGNDLRNSGAVANFNDLGTDTIVTEDNQGISLLSEQAISGIK